AYTQARQMIPDIELAVKRAIGGLFWAINSGFLAGDLLLRRAAALPLTDEQRSELAFDLDNLGVGPGALPQSNEPAYPEFAAAVQATSSRIAQKHGPQVERSFTIGLQ